MILSGIISLSYANCNLINKDVKEFMQKDQINGVAIALVKGNKIIYCNYGYIDQKKHRKVTKKTIFAIASLSKTFTANLAAIAVIESKFDLYKPITTYLPELTNPYYQQINSAKLLAHVANIPFNLSATRTKSDLINSLNQVKYPSKPQTIYSYSNPGIAIVGIALENAYKQSYLHILQDQLLHKLDMKSTFIDLPPKYKNIAAQGFDKQNKPVSAFSSIGALASAGGLKSNTHDLALYLRYQINGSNDKTLNDALNIVHKDYYCIDDQRYQQLAWEHSPNQDLNKRIDDKQTSQTSRITNNCNFNGGFIAKTGTIQGMSSYIAYSPKNKVGIVILLNKAPIDDRINLSKKILQLLAKSK